jgi:ribonuclease BN (tRNA processing enzyme)
MTDVQIRFLGSGDAFGSGGRLQTCIYVDAGTTRFLIDCGTAVLSALKHWALNPTSVDAILLTHLHGDHFGGLPFFLLDAQLVSKRQVPLVIAGPAGTAARVRAAQELFFSGSSQIQPRYHIDYLEWAAGQPTQIESLTIVPFPVVHPSGAPAYALRVKCHGKVIAYSGDTEWTDALILAAEGADLFICEAYYYNKRVKYHLDYQTLMEHRTALGCKRLILTHLNEEMLDQVGKVEVESAEDGTRIVI